MKVTETVHAIKHPFRLALGEGQYAERSVYSYLLTGDRICLIDTGVSSTSPLLLGYLKEIGRSPDEIALVLLTHAHPDHIGGCLAVQKASSASFYAHSADKPWIENVERQYQERPIPNFFELAAGSVVVNRELREGDTVSWDKGETIRVIETPGHSRGSISFLYEEEGVLFTGDAIPVVGTLPIYVDPQTSIESVQKLKKVSHVRYLLSSWHEPLSGNQIPTIMEEGIRYIQQIDEIVADLSKAMPADASGEELSLRALERLGIKTNKVLPMVRTTLESHRKK